MTCKHLHWRAKPRASKRSIMLPGELLPQVCPDCGTTYPCRGDCDHVDCAIETGRPLPDFVQEVRDAG